MRTLGHFHPHSFLLLVFAFVGNAQVGGVDVGLALVPALLLLQIRTPWHLPPGKLKLLVLLIGMLALAAVRAPYIGIPYFDSYYLWPWKAILLMLIAAGNPMKWPMGNMLALTGLCLALIFEGSMEDGRLVSVFGPNMLYRIFGFLLIFAAMSSFQYRGASRVVTGLLIAFGLFAVTLTGSSGALLVIAAVGLVVLFRISRWLGTLVAGGGGMWMVTALLASPINVSGAGGPAIYSRTIYKLSAIDGNDRFFAWTEILRSPFRLTGYTHAEFSYLWSYGLQYPHNVFIELYGFYGIIGLALVAMIVVAARRGVPLIVGGDIQTLSFAILLIGACLSGDLSDNYGLLGLAGALLLRTRAGTGFRKTKRFLRPPRATRPPVASRRIP